MWIGTTIPLGISYDGTGFMVTEQYLYGLELVNRPRASRRLPEPTTSRGFAALGTERIERLAAAGGTESVTSRTRDDAHRPGPT
ncbi:hypothetical protein AB0H49_19300 [Nocardia sp. NPDC050713]|uniref:hypothetical protein n=1 Tax=Nocardia sp. NPDC050713 TaxID=3154511 RepID=UPI0034034036